MYFDKHKTYFYNNLNLNALKLNLKAIIWAKILILRNLIIINFRKII